MAGLMKSRETQLGDSLLQGFAHLTIETTPGLSQVGRPVVRKKPSGRVIEDGKCLWRLSDMLLGSIFPHGRIPPMM